MAYNEPNPGDTIPSWDMPVEPYRCEDSLGAEPVEGDNPNYSSSADLPDQGDQRNKTGGPSNDPTPAMPGA
jgi:hypothetical protein